MNNDKVRLMRILIYEGPREWVEDQLARSITGVRSIISKYGPAKITVRTIEEFPEIVKEHVESAGEPI